MVNARVDANSLIECFPRCLARIDVLTDACEVHWHPDVGLSSNIMRLLSAARVLNACLADYLSRKSGLDVQPFGAANVRISCPDLQAWRASFGALAALCEALERHDGYAVVTASDSRVLPEGVCANLARYEAPHTTKRVAFVGHLIQLEDALRWDPSLGRAPIQAWADNRWLRHANLGPAIYDEVHVTDSHGEQVHLSFIGLHLNSVEIETAFRARQTEPLLAQLRAALALAKRAGCHLVGLGGYTSIVSENGLKLADQGIALTTGNALTVAMGLEALYRGADALGLNPADATVAVLGAAGNVGEVHARLLARTCPRLLLVGRAVGSRLHRLAARIYVDACEALLAAGRMESPSRVEGIAGVLAGTKTVQDWLRLDDSARPSPDDASFLSALSQEVAAAPPVQLTSNLYDLRTAQLIVTATNASHPVVRPEHLGAGPVVVCDLAVPADVHPDVEQRPDVRVIRGGLVRVPGDDAFRLSGVPVPPGHVFACMAETLVLGLRNYQEHYSFAALQPRQVTTIAQWARARGFVLGEDKFERSY